MASRAGGAPPKAERKPEGHRWARAMLKSLFAFAVLIVFSGLIVYAYNKGKEAGGGGTPPIIQAGPAPYKVKPDRPGGMRVANRDKSVYSRIDGAKPPDVVERLLPPAETPMAPTPAPAARAAEPGALAAPPIVPPTQPPMTVAGSETSPAPQPAAEPAPQAAAAPSAPPRPVEKPRAEQMAAAKARELSKIAPATGGDYKVQLASLRSDDAVSRSWKRLVKKNPDLLGGLKLTIVRRDLGAKKGVYYRMQAGPLPDRVAASGLCSRLKRRKINCLVVRP